MSISNPVTVFVNGNNTKKFEYESGSTLYHFSPYDNDISKYMNMNMIFFADSKEHGLEILTRMFQFVMQCNKEFIEQAKNRERHYNYYLNRCNDIIAACKQYLELLGEGKIHLTTAPTNQFFQVGWASNDIINIYAEVK